MVLHELCTPRRMFIGRSRVKLIRILYAIRRRRMGGLTMKLKQVLSIEQMKQLQELGIDTSDASMIFQRGSATRHKWVLHVMGYADMSLREKEFTYTLQDILGKLPRYINDFGAKYKLHIESTFAGPWCISYQIGICEPFVFKLAENPLNAAYEMLCWCIENGYIKINQL